VKLLLLCLSCRQGFTREITLPRDRWVGFIKDCTLCPGPAKPRACNALFPVADVCLQGFTREITLPRDCWVGFIKDYDGGTLMECAIHPKLPYTDLVNMFRVGVGAGFWVCGSGSGLRFDIRMMSLQCR
jgi:hypothetical protein